MLEFESITPVELLELSVAIRKLSGQKALFKLVDCWFNLSYAKLTANKTTVIFSVATLLFACVYGVAV